MNRVATTCLGIALLVLAPEALAFDTAPPPREDAPASTPDAGVRKIPRPRTPRSKPVRERETESEPEPAVAPDEDFKFLSMSIGSWVVIGINIAWMVPLALYFISMAKSQSKSRDQRSKLLTEGRPSPAVVISVDEVGPWLGRVPHLLMKLRVTPPGEPEFEATSRGHFRQFDWPQFQPNSTVQVRFDPNDRTFVAVVGDQLS